MASAAELRETAQWCEEWAARDFAHGDKKSAVLLRMAGIKCGGLLIMPKEQKLNVVHLRGGQPRLERIEKMRQKWEKIAALYKRQQTTKSDGAVVSVEFNTSVEAREFARLLTSPLSGDQVRK